MGQPIDLRSDVVAHPTEAMRAAMYRAELGAYQDGEDPAVAELEELGARRFGKEAALFMPSATMANLIACVSYCKPGEQVVVDEDCHVYRNELSGMARVGGVLPRVVRRSGALPDSGGVARALSRRNNAEFPISLVWVENTHNVGGGAVADADAMAALRAAAKNVPIHVDGARIFNAAVALGVPVAALVADADSISVGFNKGLACPIGCLLVGSRTLMEAALPVRRMLGGRFTKAGVVAAGCTVALHTMVDRLADDHAAAKRLAEAIAAIPGLRIESPVVTNLVRFDTADIGPAKDFVAALAADGVLVGAVGETVIRAVTHHHITPDRLDQAIAALGAAARKLHRRGAAN